MGDQSIFPTYLLSTVARQHVKVALGGDGSDELFMGYRPTRRSRPPGMSTVRRSAGARPRRRSMPVAGIRPARQASRLRGQSVDRRPEDRLLCASAVPRRRVGGSSQPAVRESIGIREFDSARSALHQPSARTTGAGRTIGTYFRGYLQEDILVKVDRASMAASLEVRSPFLDPSIIDFALSIPPEQRLRGLHAKGATPPPDAG